MTTIQYPIRLGGILSLGRCGENNARTVVIDVADYADACPDAEITLWVQRPGEKSVYPANIELKDGKLYWQITSADTAIAGKGRAEMRVTRNDILIKSGTFTFQVSESLTGAEIETPKPEQDWVDRILSAIAKIQNVHVIANGVPSDTPAGAEYDPETNTIRLSIPAGKDGEDGFDAFVTAENIRSALGYAPVKDVQVAGSSVLADGVAGIPSASEAAAGVVRSYIWEGTKIDGYGRIGLFPSTQKHIDTRTSFTAIVPTNLDKAVKAAMCDGKGAAWTAVEQKAARERMGVDGAYELIEETVLNESVTQFTRTNMSLAEMRIVVEVPVSDSVGSVAIEVYSESTLIGYGYIGNLINKENIKTAKFMVKRDRGAYVFSTVSTNANSAAQKAGVGALSETASLFPVENAITKISLYSTSSSISLPIGTKITIEGELI